MKKIILLFCLISSFYSFAQCTLEKGNADFPFTIDGVTVTGTGTGGFTNYPSPYSYCGVNLKANSVYIGQSASTYTNTFSAPVNDMIYNYAGANPSEIITVTVDSGTPTLVSFGGNCPQNTIINGNVITFSGLAGGTIKVSASNPYTSITFSHNGAAGGVVMTMCFDGVAAVIADTQQDPTLTSSVTNLPAFTSCVGSNSPEQTFTVSGSDLTDNIIVTAPTNWQVSTTTGSGFSDSVTLSQASGAVATTTVYIRLKDDAASGNISGNVSISSTGVTTETISVTGTVNLVPQPLSVSNSLCEASGLEWVSFNNVSSTTGTGILFGNITATVTHSNGGMQSWDMFSQSTFPTQFNVPTNNNIRNDLAGTFTISFSEPITNPQVAFASIGNPSNPVGITTSVPYQVIWNGQAMSYTSSTSMTGNEGFTIVSFPGTHSSLTFDYLNNETYVTMAFGAQNPNCNNITICEGDSVTLTASGGSTYAWSPSNGLNTTSGAQVIASPSVTTTYSVIDTSNSCAAPTEVVITVLPAPSAPTVPSTQLFCPGATVETLQATAATGETIEWFAAATGGTALASSTVLVAGTYYAQAENTSGCNSLRTPVVVATNNALYFDGVNDRVDLTSNSLQDGTTAFTIEAWIKPDNSNWDGAYHAIFGNQQGGTANTRNPSFYIIDGKIHIDSYEDVTLTRFDLLTSQALISQNVWSHIALVKEGTTFKVYINGGLAATTPAPNAINITGPYQFGFIDNYFAGLLDEVRFWNVSKSQSDIQATMNIPLEGSETGLVDYYNFNQGIVGGNNSGLTTLLDNTASANPGTLVDFALTGNASNYVSGFFPQITGPNFVVAGNTIALAHPISGGTWSSAATGIATVNTLTGEVTGVSGGTAVITYTYCGQSTIFTVTVNALPTLSTISNQILCANGTPAVVNFTVTDTETTDLDLLTLSATSSNEALLPTANVLLGGSAGNRTITYTPLTDQIGSTTITITASDPSGGVSTNTFIINVNTVATITTTTGSSLSLNNGVAFTIDSGIVINQDQAITELRVSINGQQIGDSLEVASALPAGVTSSFNATTGVLSISGSMTDAEAQAILQSVQFSTTSTNLSNREIVFSLGSAQPFQTNGHFYEYISDSGITWPAAEAAASNRSLYGLPGYLATVTSQDENDFITAKLSGQGWIGASDAANENQWLWVTGPEAGTQFWQGVSNGSVVGGEYNNWSANEPNNSGSGEDYAHFLTDGLWNDYAFDNANIDGYVVEYGGLTDASCVQLSATKIITVEDAEVACALPISLTSWQQEGDLSNGTWNLSNNDFTVTQTTNSSPTYFVSQENYINTSIQGEFGVFTTSDDDFFGFVLGYQSPTNATPNNYKMILFDWKQAAQNGAVAGMRVIKYDGNIPSNEISQGFWDATHSQAQVLATNTAVGGWADNTWYDFKVTYTEQNITILIDGNEVFNIDGTFEDGRFGFYNYSQESTSYRNFSVPFEAIVTKTDETCGNSGDGSATAIVSNATATDTFTYEWTGPNGFTATTNTISGLNPGIYNVTVINQAGCIATASTEIIESIEVDIALPEVNYVFALNELITPIQPTETPDGNTVFSVTPQLPTGLIIDSVTGEISGTPTVAQNVTQYTLTGTTTTGCLDTVTFTIGTNTDPVINPVTDIAASCPNTDAVVNVIISDNETIADNLILTATSDNTSVLNTFSISSTGTTRTVTMTPELDQTGTVTVTLNLEDEFGAIVQSTFDITFIDNEAPLALANDFSITNYNWSNGAYAFLPQYVDNGSTDNCGIAMIELARDENSDSLADSGFSDRINVTCADVGNTFDYLFRVTDDSGNQTMITRTLTIEDNIAPTVVSQDITVQLDANGIATITPADLDNGSSDDCSVVLTVTPLSFSCADIGTNTVTITGTDPSGNTNTATATVTVQDTVAPAVVTQDITVQLDASGTATITTADIDNGSTDNCGIDTMSLNTTNFTCDDIGAGAVILTVTDVNGNSNTATATVTVVDSIAPIVITQDITVQLGANGQVALTPDMIDNGSTDNCDITLTVTPSNFGCANIGVNTVILIGSDASGNQSFTTAQVTVEDVLNPTIVAPADLTLNTNTNCTATGVNLGNPITTDNCNVASVTNDAPTAFDLGNTTVTWTVTDGSGNTQTATQIVTIVDNVMPTITAPTAITATTDTGCTATTIILGNAITTDNCSVANVTNDAPAVFELGTTTVTWTVTDGAGNIATATQTVTVTDTILPTITAPAAITIATNNDCDAINVGLGNAVTTDNCSVASVTNDAPNVFNLGNTTVTWTVTDGSGNTQTATQIVTVVDSENPTIVAPADLTLNTNTNCTATGVNLGNPITTDNCNVASVTNDAPTAFDLGNTTVTWTVTDGSGNTQTATQIVTIVDNVMPTITAPTAITATTDTGCTATTIILGNAITTDNCSVANVTNDAPAVFELGTTTVTWTVTDGAGNIATATQTVTVTDTILPTITAPAAITIATNNDCDAINVGLGNAVTTDNCSVASVTNDAPNVFNLGNTTVTWTVTDGSGNTQTATQIVTVVDSENPTIVAPADLTLNTNTNCTATGVNLGNPITTDNCNVASVTNDAPTAFDLGNTTVTWTVTDGSGNTQTATQIVTIVDNVMPTITAPTAITATTDTGCTATTIILGNAITTDNCSVANVTNDAPAVFELGTTTVTWTVTDGAGNIATATQTVTVTDTILPTITAPAAITIATNNDCDAINVGLGNAVTTDNCSVASVTNDAPNVFNLGNTTVTWTVTDGSGNTQTATQIVTVVDSENPTIVAPADLTLNTNTNCTATGVNLGNPITTDNCNVASVTNDAPTAFDLGNTTVTWAVTDGSGNTQTATQIVTIVDNVMPTITAPTAITATTDTGCTATTIILGNAITTDNCSVANVTNDAPAVFELGTTTVTWTVTDGAGNIATATQTVTVTDTILPTITAPAAITIATNNDCDAINVGLGNAVTTDNCSVASVTNDAPNVFNLGNTTVTWTVTDGSGNTQTATQIVTVVDSENPTIVAPADLTLNTNTNCTATGVNLGNPITTDNCNVASVTNDAPTAFDLGNTTVTWTVTDGSGNTQTATQIVTIVDNVMPTITAPTAITATTDTGCTATTIILGNAITTDNCSVANVTNDAPAVFELGTTTVTWTVTDGAGNIATATQTVTVTDTILPTITAPAAITIATNNDCDAINVGLGNAVTTDNCSVASVTNDAPNVFNLGNTTVTWTVTDGSGNTQTATQIVTVVDSENPTIVAPADLTLNTNTNCTATGVNLGNPITTDNCNVASVTNDAPTAFDLGNTTVTWAVTDGSGNTQTATQIVTIVDNVMPIVNTQDITVNLDTSGQVIIDFSDVNNNSTDNCAIATLTVSPSIFTCNELGANTVVLTVTDVNGNSATAIATVTVIDNLQPIAVAQDVTVSLDEFGEAFIDVDMIENGSTDNCGIDTLMISETMFTCDNVGLNTVTLTITDNSGNVGTTTATVTVVNTFGDNDNDGLLDNCDDDDDNDGVADVFDNCPLTANPDQADNDDDGLGDLCDDDDDNDGVLDVEDNCQFTFNPGQEDRDNDGIGDACDTVEVNISEAVTPNGDGINDIWMIYNIENHPNNTVRVFNKWGSEVFFARGYNNTWNGHYNNYTQALPDSAAYYYQIDLDGNGTVDKDGWLYITRY